MLFIEDRTSSNEDFASKVTLITVKQAIKSINQNSLILKEMIENGEIQTVGGVHDLVTGKIEFYI